MEMYNNLINIELLTKDTSKMSRQEKMQHLRDMEFKRLAFRNHWTEEEKKLHRAEFDSEKDRRRKLIDNSVDLILGDGDKLTAFEKKQAENFIKENPEMESITGGVINMIAEGRNDVENI